MGFLNNLCFAECEKLSFFALFANFGLFSQKKAVKMVF